MLHKNVVVLGENCHWLKLMYYSGHGILANIFLDISKKKYVNQSLVSLINDNY
jgi:hypothetical protein